MHIPGRVQIYSILELPPAGDWSMAAKGGPMPLMSSHYYNVTGKMEDLLLFIQGKPSSFELLLLLLPYIKSTYQALFTV